MDLTWWLVAIVACVAVAVVIVAAALRPVETDPRRVRPLANVTRLTRLPAYVRAVRLRTVATVVTLVLLAIVFGCAVVAGARPTGLPTAARDAGSGQPEDVMVCAGAPADDPAMKAAMRFFAGHVTSFDTQRIGLTSANRRVIPLTRDHQYAAGRFNSYAGDASGSDLAPAVRYSDYSESVADVLALCLTGFPEFDQIGAQRRSVIYLGPGELRAPGDPRALFDTAGVQAMAEAAGAQINVLVTGPSSDALDALAADTGGRSYSAQSNVAGHLAEIRANPPPPTANQGPDVRAAVPESPDVPVAVGILAVAALSLVPLVVRR